LVKFLLVLNLDDVDERPELRTLARSVARGKHTKAAKLMNKTVVSQAQEFVLG
jgi:hypothetical protein